MERIHEMEKSNMQQQCDSLNQINQNLNNYINQQQPPVQEQPNYFTDQDYMDLQAENIRLKVQNENVKNAAREYFALSNPDTFDFFDNY